MGNRSVGTSAVPLIPPPTQVRKKRAPFLKCPSLQRKKERKSTLSNSPKREEVQKLGLTFSSSSSYPLDSISREVASSLCTNTSFFFPEVQGGGEYRVYLSAYRRFPLLFCARNSACVYSVSCKGPLYPERTQRKKEKHLMEQDSHTFHTQTC